MLLFRFDTLAQTSQLFHAKGQNNDGLPLGFRWSNATSKSGLVAMLPRSA